MAPQLPSAAQVTAHGGGGLGMGGGYGSLAPMSPDTQQAFLMQMQRQRAMQQQQGTAQQQLMQQQRAALVQRGAYSGALPVRTPPLPAAPLMLHRRRRVLGVPAGHDQKTFTLCLA